MAGQVTHKKKMSTRAQMLIMGGLTIVLGFTAVSYTHLTLPTICSV